MAQVSGIRVLPVTDSLFALRRPRDYKVPTPRRGTLYIYPENITNFIETYILTDTIRNTINSENAAFVLTIRLSKNKYVSAIDLVTAAPAQTTSEVRVE